MSFAIEHAMARLKALGYRPNIISKAKALRKFGTNPDIDSGAIEVVENLGSSDVRVSCAVTTNNTAAFAELNRYLVRVR